MASFCRFAVWCRTVCVMASLSQRLSSNYETSYSDAGTGSNSDLSVWRPRLLPNEYRVYYLAGDRRQPDEMSPAVEELPGSPIQGLASPAEFECVWTDAGSGGNKDGSFWKAIPPAGYVCLSDVAIHMSDSGLYPGVKKSAQEIDPLFRCVHHSLVTPTDLTSLQWTDRGSGAKYNGACWNIDSSPGMRVSRGGDQRPPHQQYRLKAFADDLDDYKASGLQEYCDDDDHEIPTEKECHEAAITLGWTYGFADSWPGEHKNCFYRRSDGDQMQIFFNSAGPEAAASPPSSQFLSICRTQEAAMYETPDPKYRQDKLWTDPDFHPDSRSLGQNWPELEWVRSMDLNRGRDDFLYDTVSAYDMAQGALGDCWLVAALSSAAHHPRIVSEMFTIEYANIDGWYQLWFWDIRLGQEGGPAGKWSLVLIDDFIPVAARGHALRGTPYMTKARTDGELWPPLLEKAFAKFAGSYEALSGGWSTWAWQAMGVCSDIHEYFPAIPFRSRGWDLHTFDVDAQRREMGQGHRRAQGRKFVSTITLDDMFDRLSGRINGVLAGAACCRDELGSGYNFAEVGLFNNHAYSLLMAMQVQTASGTEKLLLLRNPWASDRVFRGDWGPSSQKWDENPDAKRQVEAAMHEKNHAGDDGVWWMSLNDFNYFFFNIEECELSYSRGIEGQDDASCAAEGHCGYSE